MALGEEDITSAYELEDIETASGSSYHTADDSMLTERNTHVAGDMEYVTGNTPSGDCPVNFDHTYGIIPSSDQPYGDWQNNQKEEHKSCYEQFKAWGEEHPVTTCVAKNAVGTIAIGTATGVIVDVISDKIKSNQ